MASGCGELAHKEFPVLRKARLFVRIGSGLGGGPGEA